MKKQIGTTIFLLSMLWRLSAQALSGFEQCSNNYNAGVPKYACINIDAGAYTNWQSRGYYTGYGPVTVTVPEGTVINFRGYYGFNSSQGYGCNISSYPGCFLTDSDTQLLLVNGSSVIGNPRARPIEYSRTFAPGHYIIKTDIYALRHSSPEITLVVQPLMPQPSSISLSSSSTTIKTGEALTLNVSVTGQSPTGDVTFYDKGTPIGQIKLVAGNAQLIAPGFTSAGAHSITAVYSGDSRNLSSTSIPIVILVKSNSSLNMIINMLLED